jgi:hypothetical protein
MRIFKIELYTNINHVNSVRRGNVCQQMMIETHIQGIVNIQIGEESIFPKKINMKK